MKQKKYTKMKPRMKLKMKFRIDRNRDCLFEWTYKKQRWRDRREKNRWRKGRRNIAMCFYTREAHMFVSVRGGRVKLGFIISQGPGFKLEEITKNGPYKINNQ